MFEVLLTEEFRAWLDAVPDRRSQLRIVARIRRAQLGNLGDWKPIDGGLSEMRMHDGPGYRIYFTRRRKKLIVLIAGGDKKTQQKDIRRALRLLEQLDDDDHEQT